MKKYYFEESTDTPGSEIKKMKCTFTTLLKNFCNKSASLKIVKTIPKRKIKRRKEGREGGRESRRKGRMERRKAGRKAGREHALPF